MGCVVVVVSTWVVLYWWSPCGLCCTGGLHVGCVVLVVSTWVVLYWWSPRGLCCTGAVLVPCRPDVRERMKNEYLNDENYNFETVNRASKACGPMVQWAIAQVCAVHTCHSHPQHSCAYMYNVHSSTCWHMHIHITQSVHAHTHHTVTQSVHAHMHIHITHSAYAHTYHTVTHSAYAHTHHTVTQSVHAHTHHSHSRRASTLEGSLYHF